MGNAVLKPFGIPRASEVGHAPHSPDELRLLLRQSLEQGLIGPGEQEYAENVFAFGERRARQVMVPRPQVDFVTTSQGAREAARLATASGHTRLPLCDPEHGLDRPLGIINAKDLLEAVLAGREPPLDELARPLRRVSESIMLDELLGELRRERRHVALVVDEHGTTIGLVTLEDVIEELAGEIEDEFDAGATPLLRRDGAAVIVDGAAPLNAVASLTPYRCIAPGAGSGSARRCSRCLCARSRARRRAAGAELRPSGRRPRALGLRLRGALLRLHGGTRLRRVRARARVPGYRCADRVGRLLNRAGRAGPGTYLLARPRPAITLCAPSEAWLRTRWVDTRIPAC
jgi:CBS domain-containing protein